MSKDKPWLNEPDFFKWIDVDTGYHCVIIRAPEMLHLCGYVRVPHGQIMRGKCAGRRKDWRIEAHGGVTFAGVLRRVGGAAMRGKWIGFDCAHYMDLVPGFAYPGNRGVYRDFSYVKAEVAFLAKQLKRMQK